MDQARHGWADEQVIKRNSEVCREFTHSRVYERSRFAVNFMLAMPHGHLAYMSDHSLVCFAALTCSSSRWLLDSDVFEVLRVAAVKKEKIQLWITLEAYIYIFRRRKKKSSKIHHVINFFFRLMKIRNYFFMNEREAKKKHKTYNETVKKWRAKRIAKIGFIWSPKSRARELMLVAVVKDHKEISSFSTHTNVIISCMIESWKISHRLSNC